MAEDVGFRLLKSDYSINAVWMEDMYIMITTGRITLKEAAKEVPIHHNILCKDFIVALSPKTLSEHFKDVGKPLFNIGRKDFHIQIPSELIQAVKQEADLIHCGITKVWERMNKEGLECSRLAVSIAFQELGLLKRKVKKQKPIRTRYLFSQVNACWHGDIHYVVLKPLKEIRYLFALMDDRSRFIVGYGLIKDKTSSACADILQETIDKIGEAPFIFWSDNGGENTGFQMKQCLYQNEIYSITTIPGTPEQNGKIERFWPKLQEQLNDVDNWEDAENIIEMYVDTYNYQIPHHGLEKINKFHAYPCEVFEDPALQKTNITDCEIMIENDKGAIKVSDFLQRK